MLRLGDWIFRRDPREEIEQKMDELARKYVETHDKEIIEELYRLGRELEKLEETGKAVKAWEFTRR